MADMAMVFLLENLVRQLRSFNLVNQEMSELKSELDELAIQLTQIQPSLEDLLHTRRNDDDDDDDDDDINQAATDDDDALDKWLKQVKEVVNEAQDIVDCTFARPEGRRSRSSPSCIIPPIFNKSQSVRIRSFRETQLKQLLVDMPPVETVNLRSEAHRSDTINHLQQPEEESTMDCTRNIHKAAGRDPVVGLDAEIHTLINYLSQELQELDVIPIVGMPGLGKTTLASMVYTDSRIQREFPTRIWVQVSQDLDINRMCRTILNNFTKEDMSGKSADELCQIVSDNLKMTRYLIVLDDVWSYEDWEKILRFLPKSNRKGSKVLITTRNSKVASNASLTRDPYRLRMLCTEECFELLNLKVFGKHNSFPPELELVGRRIAKACNGLPLAIVVVGGILVQQRISAVTGTDALRLEWENSCNSISSLPLDNMEIFMQKIISLSYSKLPPKLRICFLYLGIFPEDYQIPTRRLVLLLVGEGFIVEKPGRSLEETAEAYLNELIDRNLLMVGKTSLSGRAKSCRLHDLIRDFCVSRATCVNQNLYQVIRNSKSGTFKPSNTDLNSCRLCMHSNAKEFFSGKSYSLKVRSLLCFGASLTDINVDKEFTHALKMVRVLDACVIQLPKFPPKLTRSVHLRYLTLSGNFKILPAALSNLWNLQTLLVYTLSRVLEIKDIWKLENLRHLQTNASIFLKSGKGKGGGNLQTVTNLSPESFANDVSNKARNLKELGISGALLDSMCFGNLDSLEKLKLVHVCKDPLPCLPQPNSFPSNLKSLVLSSTKLGWNHMSALEKLSNLEVLKLKDNAFVGESWDIVGCGFRRLEVLSVAVTDLKYWTASEESFVSLRILRLKCCRKLEEVPLHLGKSLEVLYMYCVTKFAVSCARKIEEERGYKSRGQERSPTSGLDVQILPENI